MSKGISRRQLKEDEVLTGLERAYVYVVEHGREFAMAAAGVTFALLLVAGVVGYRERRFQKASLALSKALTIYHAPVVGDETPPNAPKPERVFPSKAEKLTDAAAALRKVREDYSGTPSAKVATYYTGLCEHGLGNAEGAAQELQSVSEDREVLIAGLSRISLAMLARDKKEPDKGLKLLEDKRYAYPADAAMFVRALSLEDQGKKTAALERYRDLEKTFPDSAFRADAAMRAQALEDAGIKASPRAAEGAENPS